MTAAQTDIILWACSLIAAVLLGWVIARWPRSGAVLAWACTQTEIDHVGGDNRLELRCDGERVERACIAHIKLENVGDQMVREEPGRDLPLRVVAPLGSRLLRVKAIEQTCRGIGAECRQVGDAEGEIHFRALKPGEQIVVEVVHDGAGNTSPTLQGSLVDAGVQRARPATSRWLVAVAVGTIVVALPIGVVDLWRYWTSGGGQDWYRLGLGIAMVAAALMALAALVALPRSRA